MPHRGTYAGLRPKKDTSVNETTTVTPKGGSKFRTMSAIQALKYGLEKKLNRTKGWLYRLLIKEGTYSPAFHQ